MENIETLAIEINERTYSIAIAILPPTFYTLPFAVVSDHILVINERATTEDAYGQTVPTIQNYWMTRAEFISSYKVRKELIDHLPERFVRVEKVS